MYYSIRRYILSTEKFLFRYVMVKESHAGSKAKKKALFTNSSHYDHNYKKLEWSHGPFEHPVTFDTLATDPDRNKNSSTTS